MAKKKASKKKSKKADKKEPIRAATGLWSERRLHAAEKAEEAGGGAFNEKLLLNEDSTTHFYQKRDLLRYTTKAQFLTGIIDLDLLCPFFDNSMIEISGDPGVGKSTTLFHITGRSQRHCRYCRTLIADWINGETGEIARRCWCGKNTPCRALVVVSENSFPTAYARRWGVQTGDEELSVDDGSIVEAGELLTVAFPEDGEEALDVCIRATEHGMVDFIGIESLAALLPRKHRESYMKADMQVGSHAKLVRTGLVKLATEMSGIAQKTGSGPLVVWTNHLTMDVNTRNPKADPRVTRGGTGARYMKSTAIKIGSAGRDTVRPSIDEALQTGKKAGLRSLTPRFTADKTRFGTEGSKGQWTLMYATGKVKYTVGSKGQFVNVNAGTIDTPSRLIGYMTRMGLLTYKESRGFRFKDDVFPFKTKKLPEMVEHFSRDDVYMRALLLLARLTLPELSVDAIHEEAFYYPPWKEAEEAAGGRADGDAGKESRRKKKKNKARLNDIFGE